MKTDIIVFILCKYILEQMLMKNDDLSKKIKTNDNRNLAWSVQNFMSWHICMYVYILICQLKLAKRLDRMDWHFFREPLSTGLHRLRIDFFLQNSKFLLIFLFINHVFSPFFFQNSIFSNVSKIPRGTWHQLVNSTGNRAPASKFHGEPGTS